MRQDLAIRFELSQPRIVGRHAGHDDRQHQTPAVFYRADFTDTWNTGTERESQCDAW